MQDTLRFPTRIINLPGYERCVPFLSFFLFFFFFKPQGAVDIEVCCTRDFFFLTEVLEMWSFLLSFTRIAVSRISSYCLFVNWIQQILRFSVPI